MRAIVRAADWSRTPLGPMENWPQALRVTVDLCLDSPFPMHVWWGPHLVYIYNDAHIPVLGRRHPDALGRSAPDIWAEVWPLLAPQVDAVMRRGESTWNERAGVVLERHGFREDAWFTWSYSPIRDDVGRVAGLLCIATEETARVLAERERERLEEDRQQQRADERASAAEALRESTALLKAISDSTGDAIFAKDRDGRLRFANPATLALIGKPVDEVLGRTDAEFLEDKGAARTIMQTDQRIMESGVPADVEEVVRLPDGTPQVWFSRKLPNRDAQGRVVGLLGISRDITDQKQAAEALARQADALARSNLELERFAYVASHDLQEPVRNVRSYAQLLRRTCGDTLGAEAKDYLGFITSGVERMQALIVDLLEFSRVGSEGRPHAPADCNAIIGNVLANLQVSIRSHDAEITVGRLPVVIGDAVQLGQVFQNLLANAIKFRGQGTPRISVSATETSREWVFSVADNGIGIEEQYFERIFVVFQRLHTIEEYGGTGIGLAICKKIAERHGGRIWVESVPGNGSTFRFSIPKRAAIS